MTGERATQIVQKERKKLKIDSEMEVHVDGRTGKILTVRRSA